MLNDMAITFEKTGWDGLNSPSLRIRLFTRAFSIEVLPEPLAPINAFIRFGLSLSSRSPAAAMIAYSVFYGVSVIGV